VKTSEFGQLLEFVLELIKVTFLLEPILFLGLLTSLITGEMKLWQFFQQLQGWM
jgi:hypothetical protein